jgi:hypothetical protein
MHYVWNGKQWKKRVKYQPVIGRMYHVSPSDSERYYLRLLLLHVIGAKSFEDIGTYNGITFPTFKEAAKHRNLLSDDSEWYRCLSEVSIFQMPKQLRQMFAYICIFQRPYDTNVLWETFKYAMSEDFIRVSNATIAYAKTLSDISLTLKLHGQTLKSIGLPEYDANIIDSESNQQDTLSLSIQHDLIDSADQEQLDIISTIMKCVSLENTSVPNAYFIDGPGGTGKIFVYKCLINSCIEMGYDVIPVAWTGIAAMLLPRGRAVHSRFKLPLILTDTSVSSLKVNSKEASIIRKSKLII